MVSSDGVGGVRFSYSSFVPSPDIQKILLYQGGARAFPNLRKADSHSKFAIRSLIVRRTNYHHDAQKVMSIALKN
jgi:hypothetical protein